MAEIQSNIPFAPSRPTAKPHFTIHTGKRFGRWLVFSFFAQLPNQIYWLCRCDCGVWKTVLAPSLVNGRSQSCGCLGRELTVLRGFRHGWSDTPEYRAFIKARGRCTDPDNYAYSPNYGARGIEFRFTSFEQFIADIGPRPSSKHSLDRIDNEGHYEPGNVRWATMGVQLRNRRTTRLITFNGLTMCQRDWATHLGIHPATLEKRMRNWSIERALTAPVSTSHRPRS